MSPNVVVFVYGSLKLGFRHAEVVRNASRLGAAVAEPYILVRYGEYPAIASARAGLVFGELLLVDAELLARLDEFEECPELYQRQHIRLRDGRRVFAYVVSPVVAARYPRIDDGVWREQPTRDD